MTDELVGDAFTSIGQVVALVIAIYVILLMLWKAGVDRDGSL
jgi:hypothetical protein